MESSNTTRSRSWRDYVQEGSSVLHLVVTKHWFDEIASGRKKEDFREIKKYWVGRLAACMKFNMDGMLTNDSSFLEWDYVVISAGYGNDKPKIISKFGGTRITSEDEKTDLGIGRYFAIKVEPILKIINNGSES
jgi:hypothetical protein